MCVYIYIQIYKYTNTHYVIPVLLVADIHYVVHDFLVNEIKTEMYTQHKREHIMATINVSTETIRT